MALINKEKLIPVLEGYKKYFPSHWEDEKYKWEAIKHFQDNGENFDYREGGYNQYHCSMSAAGVLNISCVHQGYEKAYAKVSVNCLGKVYEAELTDGSCEIQL